MRRARKIRKTTGRVSLVAHGRHFFPVRSATRSTMTVAFRRRKRKLQKLARRRNR